jgi:hypothetical protein
VVAAVWFLYAAITLHLWIRPELVTMVGARQYLLIQQAVSQHWSLLLAMLPPAIFASCLIAGMLFSKVVRNSSDTVRHAN